MKLLIVEDSPRLRKSLTAGFTRLNFAVDSTGDGKDGLNYAMIYEYDAIILDIMLPSLDGLSLLKELRDKRKDTNVLILSAKDQVEDRINGLNLGADDYLIKPFSFDELHARIQTLIRRTHGVKSSHILLMGLDIDTTMRSASINSQTLNLTPKEYSILEYLALNQGKVMTYDTMDSHLYTSSDVVSQNTLEAHVSSLRKKLKQSGINNLVQTKRGFGYYIDKT